MKLKRANRPPPEPKPEESASFAAWGGPLFGPPDEAEAVDGTVVGGILLRRAPDGSLVAIEQPKKPK